MNPLDQQPALQTRVDALPHPSGGIGNAYSQDMREFSMHLYHNDLLDDPIIIQACQFYLFLSMQTIRRYIAWRIGLGTSVLVDELATSKQQSSVITTLSSLFSTILPIQNALLHK
jgi:hypothetical protein